MQSSALRRSTVLAKAVQSQIATYRCASSVTGKLGLVCRQSSSLSSTCPSLSSNTPHTPTRRSTRTHTRTRPIHPRTFTSSSSLTNNSPSSSSSSSSSNTPKAKDESTLPPESDLPKYVFPDPHRPDLFYHLVPPPTPFSRSQPAYALSFLGEEVDLYCGPGDKPRYSSPAVIGWLPAVLESSNGGGEETTLSDFMQNGDFIRFMHDTIRTVLENGEDVVWTDGAMQLQQGWMHIHDQRNVPALGRIGDPDDIIGTVLVEDSKIKPDTYQPMPSYRVCTADGIVQLTEGVARRLKERLLAEVGH